MLNLKKIIEYLTTANQKYVSKIAIFDELSSTNDYLLHLPANNPKTICFAEMQTKGRGRLGHSWHSPFAQNIYLSLRWNFTKSSNELTGLSMVGALAIVETLHNYGITKKIDLKWPNDVIYQQQKLAGVLVEISGETNSQATAVIGIGLNVNMDQNETCKIDQPWTDVAKITGIKADRNKLAGILLNQTLEHLTIFADEGFAPFLQKWQHLDVTYNKQITVNTASNKISGISRGIDQQGYLWLETGAGLQKFFSGEITV